jgi:hypothetical protein
MVHPLAAIAGGVVGALLHDRGSHPGRSFWLWKRRQRAGPAGSRSKAAYQSDYTASGIMSQVCLALQQLKSGGMSVVIGQRW